MPSDPDDSAGPRPTIRDIAEMVGVSVATVSRTLNNASGVSAQTRALVLAAMESHNFTRWRKPRQVTKVENLIAVRCTYALDEYFGAVVSEIVQSMRLHGKHVVLSADLIDDDQPNIQELLLTNVTEGALLILPPEPSSVLDALRATDYPFVLIDPRTAPPADIASVSIAHTAGARAATQHLIDLGHSRIAMIAGPNDQLSSDDRVLGYRTAMTASGYAVPDDYLRSVWEPDVNHGLTVARSLLELPEPPSAIVAFNDKIAVGVVQAAYERGLDVPGKLSVVGYDSLEMGRVARPPLTTVRQPIDELARMGVELLMRLINGREVEALHVELSADLVLRGSTGPAP